MEKENYQAFLLNMFWNSAGEQSSEELAENVKFITEKTGCTRNSPLSFMILGYYMGFEAGCDFVEQLKAIDSE